MSDHIMIYVEWLRDQARLSTDTEGSLTVEKNRYWKCAEAMLSLSQERDRLREGITGTIELIRAWAADESFPVESSACFQRLSAALHKDQSQ